MIPVEYFLVLSALLFFIGVFGFFTRAQLQFPLNRFLHPEILEGMFFTLFSIGVSAAETAVAVAIIINVYRHFHSDQVNSIENMKL